MLLDKLIELQEELGYTDIQFAKLLGVPRSTWQLTRTRKVPMGPRIALAAAKAFPRLRSEAVSFLFSNANELADKANILAR